MKSEAARRLRAKYCPSPRGREFHYCTARFRFLIWGIKSGKTKTGAGEILRAGLGAPRGSLCWIVAPTFMHLQAAEREFLALIEGLGERIIARQNRARHEYELYNGVLVQFRSAHWVDNLRGPNVYAVWADEAAYLKPDAWQVLRGRVAATGGEIFVTTTPRGRNWLWNEVQQAGLPADAPYGVFSIGERWVSHYPTREFPWVPEEELEDIRRGTPREVFDQEYGAMFMSDSSQVFPGIARSLSLQPPPAELDPEEQTVIGVDLAKYQDFTATVVLSSGGRVLEIERWTRVAWSVQLARIEEAAKRWRATIILDRSNVGSKIEEDLKARGLHVFPIDMNAPKVKTDLIQSLQVAFERGWLKLPDPTAPWAPPAARHLADELQWYEASLTRTGHVSYSAPRGLTDDLVVALALANWGRARGYAGGGPAVAVGVSREDMQRALPEKADDHYREMRRLARAPRQPRGIFGNRGRDRMFTGSSRKLWRR